MARNNINAYNTNDLGQYITAPVVRAIRPLPRRAQGAHLQQPQHLWHGGIPISATQSENVAGPSRSAHIPATPFPHTIPDTTSSQSQGRHQLSSQRFQPKSPERTTTAVPHSQQFVPSTPSALPRKKGLTIKLPYFLPKGKRTGSNHSPAVQPATTSTSPRDGNLHLQRETPIQQTNQKQDQDSCAAGSPRSSPKTNGLTMRLRHFLTRATRSSTTSGDIPLSTENQQPSQAFTIPNIQMPTIEATSLLPILQRNLSEESLGRDMPPSNSGYVSGLFGSVDRYRGALGNPEPFGRRVVVASNHAEVIETTEPPSYVVLGTRVISPDAQRYSPQRDTEAFCSPTTCVVEGQDDDGQQEQGARTQPGLEEEIRLHFQQKSDYSGSASTFASGSTNVDNDSLGDSLFVGGPRTASSHSTRPDSFQVGIIDGEEAGILQQDLDGMTVDVDGMGIGEGSKRGNVRSNHTKRNLSLLQDYLDILPSHLAKTPSRTPIQPGSTTNLLGKKIELLKVRSLSKGNGTASLEVVRPFCRRERTTRTGNVQNGKLFVLKRFKAGRKDISLESHIDSLTQLKRECNAYRRIAEVSANSKRGLEFIMGLEATITILDGRVGGERNESWCLILPLMSRDLAELMDESEEDLPIEDVRRILAQLCVGLATLHSIGIIHSDVKPANVLLDAQGNVKIADFGLSYTTESMVDLKVDGAYTKAKLGTMGYMAPEKVNGEKYSYPVDFWSVGWMLYEMVSVGKEHVDAHDEEDGVKEWAEEYGSLALREEFFEDEEFDKATLGLLCGLLDPNPRTRMGIEEIILHPFFTSSGESEFFKIYEKAALRTSEESVDKNVPLGLTEYVSERSDGSTYRWINPFGGFA